VSHAPHINENISWAYIFTASWCHQDSKPGYSSFVVGFTEAEFHEIMFDSDDEEGEPAKKETPDDKRLKAIRFPKTWNRPVYDSPAEEKLVMTSFASQFPEDEIERSFLSSLYEELDDVVQDHEGTFRDPKIREKLRLRAFKKGRSEATKGGGGRNPGAYASLDLDRHSKTRPIVQI